MARDNLRNIATLTTRLQGEATDGKRALAVGNGVPGGDALVLLSPGATAHGTTGQLRHRVNSGLDTTHTQDELRGDPRPPFALLLRWETRWRDVLNRPTNLAPTMGRTVQWLDANLGSINSNPTFLSFAHDLATCATQLEDVLHEGVRPELTRVPCIECGARLVKVYGQQAKDDHWRCPQCRERYDAGRLERAKAQHLASKGAERYVPIADAVATIGRPEQTVRSWIRRGLVAVARDPTSGRLACWWPHVREQHLAAQDRAQARMKERTK